MESRKSINVYIPKHFMAIRKCINILVLYGLEVRLTYSYISELRNGQEFKFENKPFIIFILIPKRVLF